MKRKFRKGGGMTPDEFRNKFLEYYNELDTKIEYCVQNLEALLRIDQEKANTLIRVNGKMKPIVQNEYIKNSDIQDEVPLLIPLFTRITSNEIRKDLLEIFLAWGGYINLTNKKGNMNILSFSKNKLKINKKGKPDEDANLIKILERNGAKMPVPLPKPPKPTKSSKLTKNFNLVPPPPNMVSNSIVHEMPPPNRLQARLPNKAVPIVEPIVEPNNMSDANRLSHNLSNDSRRQNNRNGMNQENRRSQNLRNETRRQNRNRNKNREGMNQENRRSNLLRETMKNKVNLPNMRSVENIEEEMIHEQERKDSFLRLLQSVPAEYDVNIEPEVWKPFFKENELTSLREWFHEQMIDSCTFKNDKDKHDKWSLCNINKTLFPSYFVPKNIKPKILPNQSWVTSSPLDFARYNVLLCGLLLLFGIVSERISGQGYELIFKGGKSIQFVLPKGSPDYDSEDIDLLIKPKVYNREEVKSLAGHLAFLSRWFFHNKNSTCPYELSILNPDDGKNKSIFKISYIEKIWGNDPSRPPLDTYKPLSDIDFDEDKDKRYDELIGEPVMIPGLEIKGLFRHPTRMSILKEKLFYYAKYFKLEKNAKPEALQEKDEEPSKEECKRFMEKFKKGIVALDPSLEDSDKILLDMKELSKIGIISKLNTPKV